MDTIHLPISKTVIDIELHIKMNYATEHIANTLKAARISKGLSQRELSKKAGVPQGHISKIENGAVDLRLSSLVALARALDLELTLVPRKAVPAVKSIVRSTGDATVKDGGNSRRALRELKHLQDIVASLAETNLAPRELAQLQRQVRELQHFRIDVPDIEVIRAANQAIKAFSNNTKNLNALRQALSRLQGLRDALAHRSIDAPRMDSARPAYSLDEDDHG